MNGQTPFAGQNRTSGAVMKVAQSVADVLESHVVLEVEGIDRMYLNVYVPQLQWEYGVVQFFREHRKQPWASSALMNPISRRFVAALEAYAKENGIEVVQFRPGQSKDDVMAERLKKFSAEEGIVFLGKAQEKRAVFRTEKRRNPKTGQSYPWIVKSSAMVNQYYIYAVDRDFGPFFLKFCSYFPYTAKLCLNGHEYAKRQLTRKRIAFEALDNGVLSCADPQRLQAICDNLSAEKIDALLRKWLRRLPHPFTVADRKAGYRYAISILQAEFSLTQPGWAGAVGILRRYATHKTWPWKRRVIYKAEVVRAEGKEPKDNPRFVVTNMKQSPQWIYEQVYCPRGDVENRIKELHDGLQIGRTSCSNFWANTFRVILTAAAYVLMQEMRLHLAPTRHPRAQVSTLRDRKSP